MTKKEYIKTAMSLCPTRREWRKLVNRALDAGCIDLKKKAYTYAEVYPLGAAILKKYLDWYLGNSYRGTLLDRIPRRTKREADIIGKVI